MSIPRWGSSSRGVTIVAALVLAVILVGALASLQLALPQNSPSVMTAAAPVATAAAPTPAPAPTQGATSDIASGSTTDARTNPMTPACTASVSEAKSGKDTSKGTGSVQDSCITAMKVQPNDPQYAYYKRLNGGYKCVGKDATVQVQSNGTLSINWKSDPNAAPGVCKTFACNLSGVNVGSVAGGAINGGVGAVKGIAYLGGGGAVVGGGIGVLGGPVGIAGGAVTGATIGTAVGAPVGAAVGAYNGANGGTCVPTNMTSGITPDAVQAALASPDARYVYASGNTLSLLPLVGSAWADPALLNQALGNSPTNTNVSTIPLDGSGNLASPNAQIQQIADQDPTVQAAQQQLTADVCQTNPSLCGSTSGDQICTVAGLNGVGCNGNGEYYPGDSNELQKLQQAGYACTSDTANADVNTAAPGTYTCTQSGTPKAPVAPAGPRTAAPAQGSTFPNSSGGNGGNNNNGLNSLLTSLVRGLTSALAQPQAAPAQACSTDPNVYAQQQAQYQASLQQYNTQLQQYQYQQQVNQYNTQYYGTTAAAPIAPVQPTPCTPSTASECTTQPQPDPSQCSTGTWQPVMSADGSCVAGWNCTGPTASLSCQPQTADVGMTLAISYSCASGIASSTAFNTNGQQSGSASVVVAAPPAGSNTATYALVCNNNGQTSGATCSVQVSDPTIVLVANPANVPAGSTSDIGWITTGMQSCVISSPDQSDFTTANASNTSVNGTAQTSPVNGSATFTLQCQTVAGGTKSSSVVVTGQ